MCMRAKRFYSNIGHSKNHISPIDLRGDALDGFPALTGQRATGFRGSFFEGAAGLPLHMRILVDCRPLQYDSSNGEKAHFIIRCADILSRRHGVEWFWLVDKTYKNGMLSGISPDRLVIRNALPGKAGWKFWNDWQLPKQIKKYGPDLVMTTGNKKCTRTQVPQYPWN